MHDRWEEFIKSMLKIYRDENRRSENSKNNVVHLSLDGYDKSIQQPLK
jgi:hypothetical protein